MSLGITGLGEIKGAIAHQHIKNGNLCGRIFSKTYLACCFLVRSCVNPIFRFINHLCSIFHLPILNNKVLVHGHPISRYLTKLNDQRLVEELARILTPNEQLKNTGLGEIIQSYAFNIESHTINKAGDSMEINQLHQLLHELVSKVNDQNQIARNALVFSNNPGEIIEDIAGFPQNTPLSLLVKMGNLEGAQIILPVYNREDLLFTTPRGNSVLHIAVMTGQSPLAFAIMNRANELGVLEELVNLKNHAGIDVNQMLMSLFNPINSFKNFLDMSDPLFGGEEVNKARIYMKYEHGKTFQFKQLFISGLSQNPSQGVRAIKKDLPTHSITELWQMNKS